MQLIGEFIGKQGPTGELVITCKLKLGLPLKHCGDQVEMGATSNCKCGRFNLPPRTHCGWSAVGRKRPSSRCSNHNHGVTLLAANRDRKVAKSPPLKCTPIPFSVILFWLTDKSSRKMKQTRRKRLIQAPAPGAKLDLNKAPFQKRGGLNTLLQWRIRNSYFNNY